MSSQDSAPFFSRQNHPSTDRAFSVKGRFNRLSYIAWYGLLHFIFLAAAIALSLTLGIFNLSNASFHQHDLATFGSLGSIGYSVLLVLYIYFNFVIIIRRLHDHNHSAWLCLLLFVPVVNFFFALYLLFAKGDATYNSYGHPRPATVIEKIIAWTLIILTTLSILATASAISYFVGTGDLENPREIIQHSTEYF